MRALCERTARDLKFCVRESSIFESFSALHSVVLVVLLMLMLMLAGAAILRQGRVLRPLPLYSLSNFVVCHNRPPDAAVVAPPFAPCRTSAGYKPLRSR